MATLLVLQANASSAKARMKEFLNPNPALLISLVLWPGHIEPWICCP